MSDPRFCTRAVRLDIDERGQGILILPSRSLRLLVIRRWRDKYPEVNRAIPFLDVQGYAVQFSANVHWLPMNQMNVSYQGDL